MHLFIPVFLLIKNISSSSNYPHIANNIQSQSNVVTAKNQAGTVGEGANQFISFNTLGQPCKCGPPAQGDRCSINNCFSPVIDSVSQISAMFGNTQPNIDVYSKQFALCKHHFQHFMLNIAKIRQKDNNAHVVNNFYFGNCAHSMGFNPTQSFVNIGRTQQNTPMPAIVSPQSMLNKVGTQSTEFTTPQQTPTLAPNITYNMPGTYANSSQLYGSNTIVPQVSNATPTSSYTQGISNDSQGARSQHITAWAYDNPHVFALPSAISENTTVSSGNSVPKTSIVCPVPYRPQVAINYPNMPILQNSNGIYVGKTVSSSDNHVGGVARPNLGIPLQSTFNILRANTSPVSTRMPAGLSNYSNSPSIDVVNYESDGQTGCEVDVRQDNHYTTPAPTSYYSIASQTPIRMGILTGPQKYNNIIGSGSENLNLQRKSNISECGNLSNNNRSMGIINSAPSDINILMEGTLSPPSSNFIHQRPGISAFHQFNYNKERANTSNPVIVNESQGITAIDIGAQHLYESSNAEPIDTHEQNEHNEPASKPPCVSSNNYITNQSCKNGINQGVKTSGVCAQSATQSKFGKITNEILVCSVPESPKTNLNTPDDSWVTEETIQGKNNTIGYTYRVTPELIHQSLGNSHIDNNTEKLDVGQTNDSRSNDSQIICMLDSTPLLNKDNIGENSNTTSCLTSAQNTANVEHISSIEDFNCINVDVVRAERATESPNEHTPVHKAPEAGVSIDDCRQEHIIDIDDILSKHHKQIIRAKKFSDFLRTTSVEITNDIGYKKVLLSKPKIKRNRKKSTIHSPDWTMEHVSTIKPLTRKRKLSMQLHRDNTINDNESMRNVAGASWMCEESGEPSIVHVSGNTEYNDKDQHINNSKLFKCNETARIRESDSE